MMVNTHHPLPAVAENREDHEEYFCLNNKYLYFFVPFVFFVVNVFAVCRRVIS